MRHRRCLLPLLWLPLLPCGLSGIYLGIFRGLLRDTVYRIPVVPAVHRLRHSRLISLLYGLRLYYLRLGHRLLCRLHGRCLLSGWLYREYLHLSVRLFSGRCTVYGLLL